MKAFCTIITSSHLNYAFALHESLINNMPDATLHVLIVDKLAFAIKEPKNFHAILLSDLLKNNDVLLNQIYLKYNENLDCLRWSLKGYLLYYLSKSYDKVVFTDPDTHYYGDASIIFDMLENYNVILSPHWRIYDGRIPGDDMKFNYSHGIYNAGFLAINRHGNGAMLWWSKCCLFKCDKDEKNGFYDDQNYLSIIQLHFDKIGILRHQGFNIAYWNYNHNQRIIKENKVYINDQYPVVFIHWNKDTIYKVKKNVETYFSDFLDLYNERLQRHSLF